MENQLQKQSLLNKLTLKHINNIVIMDSYIDSIIVASYFVVIFVAGFFISKRNRKENASDFLTGGKTMNWKQTGMTLVAMMFDPGVMGNTALAFLWGFYVVQWNAVNVWFTPWFAGLFFIGIYWRSKIVTTPEYLEKRFNPASRGIFSAIMVIMLISFLSYGVYNGGLLLNKLFDWNIWLSIIILLALAGFYVMVGGVKTMLTLDIFQGILLLITMFAVGIAGFIYVGGFEGIKAITIIGNAGTPLNSIIPPTDFSINSQAMYPLPTIFTFCAIAGLSWIVCNFGMAQRFLASKDESHAQKALIFAGVFNVFTLIFAYIAGIAMHKLMPDIQPDASFITLLVEYFPVGIRGFLIVGLMAALLSTIDGLLSSSATLINLDIYTRFFKPNITEKGLKKASIVIQAAIVAIVLLIIPVYLESGEISYERSAYEVLLEFLGSIMGVLVAIFILGIFFTRTTGKASFIAMIVGIILGFVLLNFTDINFANVGTMQFLVVIIIGLIGSRFEKPKSIAELENLTVWTIPGIKGPFIGFKAWPGLKYWVIGLPISWLLISVVWEWYVRS